MIWKLTWKLFCAMGFHKFVAEGPTESKYIPGCYTDKTIYRCRRCGARFECMWMPIAGDMWRRIG